ncbi:hypothetical protein CcCBS67573_g05436 [Chytriomyces confervae]|uniref:Uncharacterized protein n=1 Tax=Chytriomyces confervae TaxID=246404 RepID=A0A507FAK4_9FUNG|nr:hypothetical protein CcCBS67573_g05436 [Chytriomyces confervae]
MININMPFSAPLSIKDVCAEYQVVKDRIRDSQDKYAAIANRKRLRSPFQVGDLVLISAKEFKPPNLRYRQTNKLSEQYSGPYKIIELVGAAPSCKLALPSDWGVHPVFHPEKLKPYYFDSAKHPLENQPIAMRSIDKVLSSRVLDGHQQVQETVLSDNKSYERLCNRHDCTTKLDPGRLHTRLHRSFTLAVMDEEDDELQAFLDHDACARTAVNSVTSFNMHSSNLDHEHRCWPESNALSALSIDDTPSEELLELIYTLQQRRYLNDRRRRIPKVLELRNLLLQLDDREFRIRMRMNSSSFQFLLSKIRDHPVFRNNLQNLQAPVWIQAAVAVEKMGMFGNSACIGQTAQTLGIGDGTVVLYCRQVVKAILLLQQQFVYWPNAQERRVLSQESEQRWGLSFPLIGTGVVFYKQPEKDGEVHFCRKGFYRQNLLLGCDIHRRIRWFQTGYVASMFDSNIFLKSNLWKHPQRYFSEGEYALADSGFTLTEHSIIPYNRGRQQHAINEAFNERHSGACVCIEHVNGILKGRWGSLCGLRLRAATVQDFEHISNWQICCIILHNIMMELQDNWTREDGWELDEEDDEFAQDAASYACKMQDLSAAQTGFQKREWIK